jgi:hypothetical protein
MLFGALWNVQFEISFSPQGTSGFLRKSFYCICRYEFWSNRNWKSSWVLIFKEKLSKEYCRIVLVLLAIVIVLHKCKIILNLDLIFGLVN